MKRRFRKIMINRLRQQAGQAAPEIMLLISVLVVGVVSTAALFVPSFQAGVNSLTTDIAIILEEHKIDGEIGPVEMPEVGPPVEPLDSSVCGTRLCSTNPTVFDGGNPFRQRGFTQGFDGILSDVSTHVPETVLFAMGLAMIMAGGIWWSQKTGEPMTHQERVMMDEAMAKFLAAGGKPFMLETAYDVVDHHNGDVRAAYDQYQNGGARPAVQRIDPNKLKDKSFVSA